MRKFVISFSLLFFGSIAHAEVQQNQLFDCMDAKSFEVNSQCVEAKISQNMQFREMQLDIANKAAQSSNEQVMATIKFHPQDMLIEIVAHRDALSDATLMAANRTNK